MLKTSANMTPLSSALFAQAEVLADPIAKEGPGAFGLGTTDELVAKFIEEAGSVSQNDSAMGAYILSGLSGLDRPAPPPSSPRGWYPKPPAVLPGVKPKSARSILSDIDRVITEGLRDVSKIVAEGLLVQFMALQEQGELHARYTSIYGAVLDSRDPKVRCGSPEREASCKEASA